MKKHTQTPIYDKQQHHIGTGERGNEKGKESQAGENGHLKQNVDEEKNKKAKQNKRKCRKRKDYLATYEPPQESTKKEYTDTHTDELHGSRKMLPAP